jgi:hypothetical protein
MIDRKIKHGENDGQQTEHTLLKRQYGSTYGLVDEEDAYVRSLCECLETLFYDRQLSV